MMCAGKEECFESVQIGLMEIDEHFHHKNPNAH